MITAAEARKLTNESELNVLKWLDYFDKKVKEAAANNKSKYECIEPEFKVYADSLYYDLKPNYLQSALIKKLLELGYNASWRSCIYKAGGGLGDLDDTPMEDRPDNKKYYIEICW